MTVHNSGVMHGGVLGLQVRDLRTERTVDPLGIDERSPVFGWKLLAGGQWRRQTRYHLIVESSPNLSSGSRSVVWDTRWVESDQCVDVPYDGDELRARTRYFWQVRVADESGRGSDWSEPARFETGLLQQRDWNWVHPSHWVTSPSEPDLTSNRPQGAGPHGRPELANRPALYLSREFTLDDAVKQVRVYASALGAYELYVNGEPASDAILAPGWVDYRAHVPYQTYDIGALVGPGTNSVTAIVTDGWYAGNIGIFGPAQYGTRRAFRARIEATRADGTVDVVGTDDTWSVGGGPIRYSDLQNGQIIDARVRPSEPGADAGEPPSRAIVLIPACGPMVAQLAPPIVRQLEVGPRSVTHARRHTVIDFGQNLVGHVRIRLGGQSGERVVVQHAEALDEDGSLYTAGLRSARATDEFVLDGSEAQWFEPTFTVHGFRYAKITGYSGAVGDDDIRAIATFACMDEIGTFETSDPQLNQLQSNIVWSQRGNFVSVPTDCPQRDERLGWTGDAHLFTKTAAFNYDVRAFLRNWLRELRGAQQDDGAVPNVVPDVLTPNLRRRRQAGVSGWGDACAFVPWDLWWAYGDRRALEESFPSITQWVGYLRRNSSEHLRPAEGFGDWLAPEASAKDLVATAFFAGTCEIAARIARVIGEDADADAFHREHEAAAVAFVARFVRSDGRLILETQTGYVLALQFDLLPAELRGVAVERLVTDIRAHDTHLTTGFLGTPYLLPVLSRFNQLEVAEDLLHQDSSPSWLYPIVKGDATTIWERWDSWHHSRGFNDPGMTSFNHYAYGSVGAWMYEWLGGVRPMAPGYRTVAFHPARSSHLSFATVGLETPYGPIHTHWSRSGGRTTAKIDLPPNIDGHVQLPPGRARMREGAGAWSAWEHLAAMCGDEVTEALHVGSGSYEFVVEAED